MSDFDISELVPLLAGERNDVRQQALQIAAQVVQAENVAVLCQEDVFSSIMACMKNSELRIHAATLIINILAVEGEIIENNEKTLVENIVNVLTSSKPQREEVNMFLILLTNLTISEELCDFFIQHCRENNLSQKLLSRFLDYNPQAVEGNEILDDYSELDVWQYFSSVLCNICRLDDGRRLLLSVSSGNMEGCLKQFRSKNPIRRRGVVACVRSCLFNSDIHWWMVNEMNVLSYLLLPLVTSTEFTETEKEGMDPILWMQGSDKLPDPEVDIQKMLLECLQLLGQKRAIREEMRKRKVYPICRNLDYLQDDEDVSNIIYEIVQLTMGEEDPNTPIDDVVVQKPMVESISIEDSTDAKDCGEKHDTSEMTADLMSSNDLDSVD